MNNDELLIALLTPPFAPAKWEPYDQETRNRLIRKQMDELSVNVARCYAKCFARRTDLIFTPEKLLALLTVTAIKAIYVADMNDLMTAGGFFDDARMPEYGDLDVVPLYPMKQSVSLVYDEVVQAVNDLSREAHETADNYGAMYRKLVDTFRRLHIERSQKI